MNTLGKEVGKAIRIPPFINRLKNWARRVLGNTEYRSLTRPWANNAVGETDFGLSIPMPGFNKNDLKMEIQGNTLIISGEKEQSREARKSYGERRELVRSTFRKTLDLPRDIAPESIHATLENGLLQVRFSKRETTYRRLLKVA